MSVVELGRVAQVFNGKTPAKGDQRSTGHAVLKIRDIDEDGRFRGSHQSFVEPSFAEQFGHRMVRRGDTLILNAAHNADYVASKVALAGEDVERSLATGEWLIVRPTGADARFVHYWIRSAETRRSLRELVKGIHLYPKDVARMVIPLPSPDEQRRIADILDKADAIRRKRKEAIALTEELLRSAFLDMFGDPVTNPKGWAVRTAADVCGSFGGALQTGPFGSQLHASDYTEEGVPVVMPQDLIDGGISTARVARVSAEHVARLERHKLELGDVVFSRRGDVARFAVVEHHQVGWLCGTGCLRIRFAGAPLTAAFLRGELEHPSKREWLESEAKGTTMPNLNTAILGKLSIRMPPRSVQEALEQITQRVRAMRSEQLQSSTDAGHLFNTLVARAFSGNLS